MLGDRNSDADLAALRDGQWDATVDVNAYLPRQVRALAGVLHGQSIDEVRAYELRSGATAREGVGLAPEREAELLAGWAARKP